MLTYSINRRNLITENTQNVRSSTEFELLKLIINKLSKSQTVSSTTKSASFDNFNFKNEDAEAYCITSMKNLVRSAEPNTLSTIFSSSASDFPIFKYLLNNGLHPDVMIRNAARICLMSIFQKCQAIEYIVFEAIPNFVNDILKHVKKVVLDMQDCYGRSSPKLMKEALCSYQEEFEYIDDILKLNLKNKDTVISQIMKDFVRPFILTAIIENQIEYISPICKKIGLCLLSTLLESITDTDMNECIMKLFLHERVIPVIRTDLKLKQQQINKNLLLILLKRKTNIDTLLILNIYSSLQSFILKTNISRLGEFYHMSIFVLMELLKTNNQSKPSIECLKLKLLISILQPLTEKKSVHDANLIRMKNQYLRNLEILCKEIRIKILPKISFVIDIIDEEYEIFTDSKIDIGKLITDKKFFDDRIAIHGIKDIVKLELYHLFCIRFLYFEFNEEKNRCLPLIKKKEEIGKTVAIDNSVPCVKFIGGNLYQKDHFVKMTDRQLLILQNIENKTDGTVIFNSYYKDIAWSVNKTNLLKLSDDTKTNSNVCEILSKPFSIYIKFANTDDLKFVIDSLNRAKESQIKTVKRKLEKLLFGNA